VREIPPGFVRTYGDVSPGAPRFAGAVLFECDEPDLPWWRVVRADGSLAKGARQRERLRAEGVPFRGDRVDMAVALLVARGDAEGGDDLGLLGLRVDDVGAGTAAEPARTLVVGDEDAGVVAAVAV